MPDKNLFETTLESLPAGDHRMRTWLAIVGCFTSVERLLRRRFNHAFGSSLPRYDVLTALMQFPDGLTMGQLASKLMVSKGNITGVVGRLQKKPLRSAIDIAGGPARAGRDINGTGQGSMEPDAC